MHELIARSWAFLSIFYTLHARFNLHSMSLADFESRAGVGRFILLVENVEEIRDGGILGFFFG